ncbi:mannose-1-phosphate guanylyltransferase/mannose-6-phosphate isomerase [Cohaesibacter sp. CAU 1516]|uniref:sugar phosphate nucleotidyltransferase n=1 Tax=Cohaesibacter sp. CAU 1516 TaxID=2576038 RepID=UPI0010FE1EDA|nr:sugar phosphate nucleotidyltransferase [Cohaesibacter sp. CAU 1516]TLP47170.1 mannose-1-phosphate guanylyltransferase/mannose-6-phosphate isomerase [Cohaesibacter sp. CAU 1516]
MSNIYPLILCGGVGTRLWPLSRSSNPKQFQPIDGSDSTTFFQTTILRHVAEGFEKPLVSVNRTHLGTVKQQLNDIDVTASILSEPIGRNTGPAVLAAAMHLVERDPDAILAVLPSDHVIKGDLNGALRRMIPAAEAGKIVLFGIEPRYPETGYGYIIDNGPHSELLDAHTVSHFVEKPPFEIAEQLITDGNAYWASGISLFRADVIIADYEKYDPDSYQAVIEAYAEAEYFPDRIELCGKGFAKAFSGPTESIIFEKTERAVLSPSDIDWNDVGAWKAFHAVSEKDSHGNYICGDVVCIESNNSYIRGSNNRLVAALGVDNLVIVDTDDALLVTTHEHSQKVKSVIQALEQDGRKEVVTHATKQFAWGQFVELQSGNQFNLAMLRVEPGKSLLFDDKADCHRLLSFSEGQGSFSKGAIITPVIPGEVLEIKESEVATFRNTGTETAVLIEIEYQTAGLESFEFQPSPALGFSNRKEEVA